MITGRDLEGDVLGREHVAIEAIVHSYDLAVVPTGKGKKEYTTHHNVFLMVTDPEWIPARRIHNGNKYPIDLEIYFQNGNRFHMIWISIQRKFPNQLETVSKQNGNPFPFWKHVSKLKRNYQF